jgi:hypothetical protein
MEMLVFGGRALIVIFTFQLLSLFLAGGFLRRCPNGFHMKTTPRRRIDAQMTVAV